MSALAYESVKLRITKIKLSITITNYIYCDYEIVCDAQQVMIFTQANSKNIDTK